MTDSQVCVLVPTYQEAETIGEVVDGFTEQGFDNVLVVDGNSTDGTQDVAREHGARVIEQSGTGKGQAVREALQYITAPYVLMIDGDATYDPRDAERMLEPLLEGYADHVIGDRFAEMDDGAMTWLNGFGNRLINTVFEVVHGRDFADILSGYRAFTMDSVRRFELTADGFTIETELAVECVKHRVPTAVVPVRYHARPDESDTNLNPLSDGGRIIFALYALTKTNNPLFYFGSVGLLLVLFGGAMAGYVGFEWFTQRISHEVLAIVAGIAILLGTQLLAFGFLSDMIVAVNREQTRRLEELTDRLEVESPSSPTDSAVRRTDGAGVGEAAEGYERRPLERDERA
ncbi:S-layer glycoprotein N-glycosyltransferase AglJ [Halomarina ordinaria]|uniref:S-layer glycoprotein N-glycosyltransferase AglJ n=1 Tax=Halomarina ordinaria TaxID=3033939 RepID=A0ABD5UAN2_9EURY|nr:S-layer glycoprotein N-glycosyltransferase AglJ [Halomarina sp. PSRA2]